MTRRSPQECRRCLPPRNPSSRCRGICFGGGLMLALCCDLRLVRADARFRLPAARLGLGYGPNNIALMLRRLGETATAES